MKDKEIEDKAWYFWDCNFARARRFFESSNLKTKARLKKKWQNNFYDQYNNLLTQAKREEREIILLKLWAYLV